MKISIQYKNMPVVAVVFNLQITIIMFLYANNYKSEHLSLNVEHVSANNIILLPL